MIRNKPLLFVQFFLRVLLVLPGIGCRSTPPQSEKTGTVINKGSQTLSSRMFAPDPDAHVIEWIVAVVNNEIILHSELEQEAFVEYQSKPNPAIGSDAGKKKLAELRSTVLNGMIDSMLILQQAQDPTLSALLSQYPPPPYDEVIKKSKELLKAQNRLTDEQLIEAIKGFGLTEKEFEKQLYKRFKVERILSFAVYSKIRVTDEEIRRYYEKVSQHSSIGSLRVHIMDILIPVSANASSSEIESKQKLATDLTKDLKSGLDFQAVAKEYEAKGISPVVDPGFLSIGDLPDALKQVILLMGKNEVQGPIRLDRGFHVIKLLEKRNEDIRPFEEVKEDLRNQLSFQLRDEAQKAWVKQLRRKAYIDIRLDRSWQ